jgi:hypothetical protein
MIAEGRQEQEELGQQLLQELKRLWEAAGGMKDADALEMAVQAWQRGMGRRVMEALCQEAIRRRQQQAPECCQQRMDNQSLRPRTVKTLLGDVRVWRRYYRCLRCGRRLFAADQWLGWKGDFSHRVQEAVAWQVSLLPYRQALENLSRLAGVELTVDAAESIVARWGKEELSPAPYAERVKHDLVVQIDGAKAHLEEGWQEIKVGAFFSCDRRDPKAKPAAVSYVADWKSAQEFRQTLWQEALVRGAFTAGAVAVVGDGAPWIWETASWLFPQAIQILDWYHLTEHLGVAAKVVYGERTPAATALVEQWKTEVWEGRSEGVEEHLREFVAARKDDKDNTLRKCADYLQTHQARLRYHLFRAAGWPIGSGVVEGACKHLVGLRFKRQSTRWTKAGARAVLHLRLDRLNGRWDARGAHVRQQLRQAA